LLRIGHIFSYFSSDTLQEFFADSKKIEKLVRSSLACKMYKWDGIVNKNPTTISRYCSFKESLTRDFRLKVFFHKSVSPGPLSISLGPFRIFSKIRGDIRE
jgi:hypothetical protein